MLALLLVAAAAPAHAQLDYYGRIGMTGSTPLVRDVLFEPFETRQGLAPTLVAGFSIPVGTENRLGIEGSLVSGSLTTAIVADVVEVDASPSAVPVVGSNRCSRPVRGP